MASTLWRRVLALVERAIPPLAPVTASGARGAWYPYVREPYTGAWQNNDALIATSPLSYFAVFACITLIASDISKLRIRLVALDADGVWTETTNPAYSPVLRQPNRYQTFNKLAEQWIISKLIQGNTYVLKQRDARGVVVQLYVLDPAMVRPLVAPDGSVYYSFSVSSSYQYLIPAPPIVEDTGGNAGYLAVPASEIIHDRMVVLGHPLIGVTPLYACGLSAQQGLTIQNTSTKFFASGSNPGGVLTAPGSITQETATRLKTYWDQNFTGDNVGKVAVLGDGLKYEAMAVTAQDAQLIDQLKWTAETVCACYHVPPYMVQIGAPPPYGNFEAVVQQYYAQCLQSLITSFETALDAGLEFPQPSYLGTEFDIDDLIWMDTATRTKAAAEGIGAGALSPDEARFRYFGLGKVKGGDTPYLQQQYFSLQALAERDSQQPFAKAAPAVPAMPATVAKARCLARALETLTRVA